MNLKANLADFSRIFVPGTYRASRYDEAYADKAERHALNEASRAEIDWVAAVREPAAEVLDLGCNTGLPLERLCTAWQAAGTGLDVSEAAINRARRNLPRFRFELYDGRTLPGPDGAFHHVMLHHVLGHLADPARMLGEIRRVLRPGGTLSVICPNAFYKFWQFPVNLARGFAPDPTILRYYTRNALRRTLQEAGFTVLRLDLHGAEPDCCPAPWRDPSRLRLMALALNPPAGSG